MKPRPPTSQKSTLAKNLVFSNLFIVGAALLVLGIAIGFFLEESQKSSKSVTQETPVFSAPIMMVAKHFSCSCGSCGEKALLVCECPTAISTKRFIEQNLNQGLNHKEVVELVKSVYGHYIG